MAKMSKLNGMTDRKPPPDALPADRQGFIERTGARLRYAVWNASGTPLGSVVLVQGRGEFIEKYAMEVAGELLGRGFAVYALDLRGQGLSDRLLADRDKGHIDDFATYVADLELFMDTIVAPAAPRPILALSHSTGGNIVLRYLIDHGSAPFVAAVFSSPMTGLPKAWFMRSILAVLSPFPGLDTKYAPGTGPYDPAAHSFAGNDVTNDERRFRFTDRWFYVDPRLRLGGPTIGWVRQAFRSFDAIGAPGALEQIRLPVLIASAGDDTVVDTASHAKAASRIEGARHVTIEGAKHEILMETDPRRAQFWAAFDRLAAEVAGPQNARETHPS
jgi:lysophospholipase